MAGIQCVFPEAPVWTDGDFFANKFGCQHKMKINFDTVLPETATPSSIFWDEFFPNEMLDLIVHETNIFEEQKPIRPTGRGHQKPWSPIDREELRAYLSITIVLGYHTTPQITDAWSTDPSLQNILVKASMARDRYVDISSRLHFYDNTAEGDHKLRKLLPILNMMTDIFQRKFTPGPHVTVDESLFKYKGRLGFKQYIATKRARFGFKVYRLCSSVRGIGYTLGFKVYHGKEHRELPVQQDVVMKLARPLSGQGHTIAIDRGFTCPELVQRLHNERFNVVGTVQKSRKYLPVAMKDVRLKKGDVISRNSGVMNYIVWQDKRDVRMLTTMHTDRTVADKHNRLKPKAVVDYNKWKVGVDVSDQLASSHSSTRRTIRWYIKLFFYFFDMAMTNAFVCYKHIKGPMAGRKSGFTNFKIELARETLLQYNQNKSQRPPQVLVPRLTPGAHFLYLHERRSCHVCWSRGKRQATKYRCDKCNVSLCVDPCNKIYHTKENY